MDNNGIIFSAFTKPWPTQLLDESGILLSKMDFNGVEFCLREGYQIEPANAKNGLKELVKVMEKYGVTITSIASNTDENIFETCSKAGVSIIRNINRTRSEKGICRGCRKRKEKN